MQKDTGWNPALNKRPWTGKSRAIEKQSKTFMKKSLQKYHFLILQRLLPLQLRKPQGQEPLRDCKKVRLFMPGFFLIKLPAVHRRKRYDNEHRPTR